MPTVATVQSARVVRIAWAWVGVYERGFTKGKVISTRPFYKESLMKYTERCTNDFTGRGRARREEARRAERAEEDRDGLDEDKQNHA